MLELICTVWSPLPENAPWTLMISPEFKKQVKPVVESVQRAAQLTNVVLQHHPTHRITTQVGIENYDVIAATQTWACVTTNHEKKWKGKFGVSYLGTRPATKLACRTKTMHKLLKRSGLLFSLKRTASVQTQKPHQKPTKQLSSQLNNCASGSAAEQ